MFVGEAARSERHPALPSAVLILALGQELGWAASDSLGSVSAEPVPGCAQSGVQSGRAVPRHRASAGGRVSPCGMPGPGSAPTPPPAPVNCAVGFLLPCPGVQCVHCYCCLLPPLKITLSLKHQPQRGKGSLMFMQSPGLSLFMGAECTETRHAMLGSREVAQPWPAHVPRALRVPPLQPGSWPPQSPVNTGQGRLNFDTAGLAHLQD